MASLWMRGDNGERVELALGGQAVAPPGGRTVAPFAGRGEAADEAGARTSAPEPAAGHPMAGVSLIPVGIDPTAPWVLIANHANHAAQVTVNGEPIPTGIRIVESRDEIRCGQTAAVFTNEHLAHVEPFPGAAHTVPCARCTCDIASGSPAVRCPVCGSWYHQQDPGDFPCWTAVPFCQACGCATTAGGEPWEPEEF